jgi:hypothetical protein
VLLALTVFAVLSLLYTWPFPSVFRDHLTPDIGDPLFNLYVLEWGRYQLSTGLPDLWNAPFLYPTRDALALSDHLIGPAAQTLLLRGIAGTSIGAYNLLLLSALLLSGTTMFWVLRQADASRLASFCGGLAFAFSPYHWSQLSHLQVFMIQWIPLVIWFWYRLLRRPRLRYAAAFIAFYAAHMTGGSYLAYMIHVPLAAIAVSLLPSRRRWLTPRGRRILLLTVAALVTVAVAVFLPNLLADHDFETSWSTLNYKIFGATSVALLTPSHLSPAFDIASGPLKAVARGYEGGYWFAEKSLFPGLLPGALALTAAISLVVRYRVRPLQPISGHRRAGLALLLSTALTGFVAADLYSLGWWFEGAPPRLLRPGFVYSLCGTVVGVALAFWLYLRRRWAGVFPLRWTAMPPFDRGVLALGVLCLALAFPAIYEPLAEVVPGLDRMRVPSRFYTFTTFAAAYFAAQGLDLLRRRLAPPLATTAAIALLAAMALELAPRALPWHRIPIPGEFPPVYQWLAEHDDVRALVELPLRNGPDELPYMLYSTAHWKPLVNGYSAHTPPVYLEVREACASGLPEPPCLELLRAIGVSHVVVHPVWQNPDKHRAFGRWLEKVAQGELPAVRIVYAEPGGDRVAELAPLAGGSPRPRR